MFDANLRLFFLIAKKNREKMQKKRNFIFYQHTIGEEYPVFATQPSLNHYF